MDRSTAVNQVTHLDHFALPAMNLDRAEKFYTEVLEARVIIKDPQVPGGIFMKLGREHHLGLFTQKTAKLPIRDTINSYPKCAFILAANDFARMSETIQRNTLISREIEDEAVRDTKQQKALAFMDSEGNILEIIEGQSIDSTRIHHLHFDTPHLAESIKFYTEILDFEVVTQTQNVAVLSIPTGQYLMLHQVKELSEVTKTHYDERHFAFCSSDRDFHAIVDRLHEKGIKESDELGGGANRKPGDLSTYFKEPVNGI